MPAGEESLKTAPNNLPHPVATFIGRKTELTWIGELLGGSPQTPPCRLLTLTGIGGVGKTRLALEAGALLLNLKIFPGGVWLVKLAALFDPGLVSQSVVQVLGLRNKAGVSYLDTLKEYLQTSQQPGVLLILDNCEHLIGACAELAENLVQSCPGLSILATSREALNIEGEVCLNVPPLSLPPSEPDAGTISIGEIGEAEAVQFFMQKGAAVLPDFKLSQQNALSVIQICRRLDGLPLALELACARLKGLPLNQLAARLDDRFRLFTGGSRTALPRHQTLQALLDWSYNLLGQAEQVVFRRLAAFAGSFTLEAAEFVCSGHYQGAGGVGRIDKAEVLDVLTQLVAKSMILLEPDKNERGASEQCYRLLETLRHYSQERAAEAGETSLIGHKHLEWCVSLAEKAEPHLQGPEQIEWLQRLEAEQSDFRAGLGWALKAGTPAPDQVLRLCGALWRFWQLHSHFIEGRRYLEVALSQVKPDQVNPLVRAKALHGAGVLLSLSDYEASLVFHQENLNIRREVGDLAGLAVALRDLGWLALHHNDFARAKTFARESLELDHSRADQAGVAASLFVLSVVAFFQGDSASAVELSQKCLDIWRELGDLGSCASALNHLGMIALREKNYTQAGPLVVESLNLNWQMSNMLGVANTMLQIIELSLAQGAGTTRAVQLLGWLENLTEKLGGKMPPLARLSYDSSLAIGRSRLAEPESEFNRWWEAGRALTLEQAISLAREAGSPAEIASSAAQTPSDGLPETSEKLTRRESEVLKLLAMGLSNARIAQEMFITARTVNAHLTSIYAKLGVKTRGEAIRYTHEHPLSQ